ncbi:MAG: hypothetical protein AYK19_06605 [Theionarchaea archaeon DG-70-1]|nr:MAG: hypothetical protein AYK19_06605 [Theionarchaea archaeon DG-70-1]
MTEDSVFSKVLHPFRYLSRALQKIKSLLKKEKPVLINLTPHDVVIRQNGEDIVIPRSEKVARVRETEIHTETINGVQVTDIYYDKTLNLPEPKDNTYYIVSIVVAYANCDRQDLVFPDGLNAYRDEKGQIEAVPGLRRVVEAPGATEKIARFFSLDKK